MPLERHFGPEMIDGVRPLIDQSIDKIWRHLKRQMDVIDRARAVSNEVEKEKDQCDQISFG